MKMKTYRLLAYLMIFVLMLAVVPPHPLNVTANRPDAASHEMRGLWVTSAYNLDWPSRHGLNATQLRSEIDGILSRATAVGINAVFVQVRPTADSLFPSEIFPWSSVFTGTPGLVPAFYSQENFDPLAYWIEAAHALGIEVHAWLNPFRVTHRVQGITNPAQLPAGHPVRENPSLAISYGGGLFLDPGNPAARQLIADGVAEILRNYPTIDGIHLDDYFYPSRNFPDTVSFTNHGAGFADVHQWRRENINATIRLLQETVRANSPTARWGVSPTGIWMNVQNDPRGSVTGGNEHYHSMYADSRRWVLEGWVDYIVPQIYWQFGHPSACYENVLAWWESVVAGTDVHLYVGMSPYREELRYTDARFANWTEGEIIRQLERNSQSDVVRGAIFFREAFMRGEVGAAIGAFYQAVLPDTPAPERTPEPSPTPTPTPNGPTRIMTRLSVAQPANDRSITDAANFNFFGTALPDLPLYVNGQPITNRTAEGFFSIFLPLTTGVNRFEFTQPGVPAVVRTITNLTPPPPAQLPRMDNPAITNVFPATDEWAQTGDTITLRATAPAGATVTARVGDYTVNLTQTNPNLASTATRIYAATFTGQFTMPPAAPHIMNNLGRPIYTATFNGQSFSATAAGNVRQLGPEAPFFAEITAPAAWAFPNATLTGGSAWQYVRGQHDRITAITGGWTRLSSGFWVESENIRTFNATAEEIALWFPPLVPEAGILSEGMYRIGEVEDRIRWYTSIFPAVAAHFDGSELIVTFGITDALPPIFLPREETLFSEIRTTTYRGAAAYAMTLREGAILEGFYVEYVNGAIELVLRRRRSLTPGNEPLAGFTFVLDAGHGGTDPGAVGPMGGEYAEKHIVMDVTWLMAERLEMLGAEVVLTRDGDYNVSLQARTEVSRQTKPDMFISIHSNSTAETTNATNIHGFTMWYRNPSSRPAAWAFMAHLYDINPLTNRSFQVNQANFFVCRPTWSPSILVELSFTNNIQDFAWMIHPERQVDMAWGMVNAILTYYR